MNLSDETKRARSCVAMLDGDGEVLLDLTTEDGRLFSFTLQYPEITLESLQNALANKSVRSQSDSSAPGVII